MTTGPAQNAALASIQTLFQQRLLADAPEILGHLTDGGPFMKVYDEAYMIRLVEVMGEDFPGVHTLLGDDRFLAATRDYIRSRPSTRRSVRWLGSNFARWMRKTEPWRDMGVVADMAAFEWALGLAFDAPDHTPVSVEALADVPPEVWADLGFDFHPAFNTLELAFDVAPFQQAVAREVDPEAMPGTFDHPGTWAVWRHAETLMVRYRALPSDEAAGLDVVHRGGTFQGLCETLTLSGDPETAALRAAGLLRHWVESGWITGLTADRMMTPIKSGRQGGSPRS